MELDYLPNVNEFDDNLVRLYNFDKNEAAKFKTLIETTIIKNKQKLDLSTVDFIERRNCNLIMGIFKTDEGMLSNDNETFYCALTLESFERIVKLIDPFCHKDTKTHQYLYELDIPTDFLFSPQGTW
jgi:hypothetical protein